MKKYLNRSAGTSMQSDQFSCDSFPIYMAWIQENLSSRVCEQQRCKLACASMQSDQRLVIHLLESIISRLAISEISIFKLVSVASDPINTDWSLTYR